MPEPSGNSYLWDIENPGGYANAGGRYRTKKQLAFLSAHLVGERLSILDVGGGSGRFAIPLAERGHRVTVVDISRDALRLLHRRRPQGISTRLGDFLSESFDDPFDVLLAMESVQYFTSVTLDSLFAKIFSLLRPGGLFVFTGLNSRSWRHAGHKFRGPDNPSYRVAAPREYRDALERAGFELVSVDGFVWMPVASGSDSPLVPVFEWIERALHLNRWTMQSPWLLYAARRSRAR